jgi:hypothetical protein
MSSACQAAQAARKLRGTLSKKWWLELIDFSVSDANYVVNVRVKRLSDDVLASVPAEVDGVEVKLVA